MVGCCVPAALPIHSASPAAPSRSGRRLACRASCDTCGGGESACRDGGPRPPPPCPAPIPPLSPSTAGARRGVASSARPPARTNAHSFPPPLSHLSFHTLQPPHLDRRAAPSRWATRARAARLRRSCAPCAARWGRKSSTSFGGRRFLCTRKVGWWGEEGLCAWEEGWRLERRGSTTTPRRLAKKSHSLLHTTLSHQRIRQVHRRRQQAGAGADPAGQEEWREAGLFGVRERKGEGRRRALPFLHLPVGYFHHPQHCLPFHTHPTILLRERERERRESFFPQRVTLPPTFFHSSFP